MESKNNRDNRKTNIMNVIEKRDGYIDEEKI